jgi:hypothetical protein
LSGDKVLSRLSPRRPVSWAIWFHSFRPCDVQAASKYAAIALQNVPLHANALLVSRR